MRETSFLYCFQHTYQLLSPILSDQHTAARRGCRSTSLQKKSRARKLEAWTWTRDLPSPDDQRRQPRLPIEKPQRIDGECLAINGRGVRTKLMYIHANDPYSLLANLEPQKTHSCHASEDPERGLKYKIDPVLKPTAGPCQHPTQRQPLHLYAFFSCPSYSVVKKSSHRLEALGAIVADQQLRGAQIYQRCDLMILRNAKSPAALVAEGPAHWSRSLPEKFTSS
jgi:hypothetical protein